jgi:rhamnogalacturonan endolyase
LRRLPVRCAERRSPARVDPLEGRRLLAFGLTTTSTLYTVDTGAGVTFSVLRGGATSSTIHIGDLTSFKRNGVEFSAPYSSTSRYSHFESGLSNPDNTVSPPFIGTQISATVDPAGNWIKITCDDTTATVGTGATGVIHYYMARKNDPVIYMATYAPEMLVSSTRFITYLDWNKFPNHPQESDTSASTGAIESADVFGRANGTTASKYYGEIRNVEHVYHGATGPSAGAFMFVGNRERGSGGPFWKDIDFQSTGAAVELYNMPYSGHSQTEAFRPGLHGPFALVLTGGGAPTTLPDYSFIDGLGLTGWVSPSARGALSGKATGIAAGRVPTVGLSNAAAQYWATPDASGNYSFANVIPGTYTQTLYDEELAVATRSVTITAGQTTRVDITNTYYLPANPVFRIGTFDGTPREFMNGDKITIMHPSDVRMSPWTDTTFTVGSSATNTFPMALWKRDATQTGTVANITLSFNLTTAQKNTASTLRIAITRAAAGGRPIIQVNGGSFTTAPAASTQPDTRGITLGNWRGNNWLYTYAIASSALVVGTNTIKINVASGSSSTSPWLQPSFIFDAIDLVPTTSVAAPVVSSVTLSPANGSAVISSQSTFTATARDSSGNVVPANFDFSATRGVIDDTGLYIAPATTGADTVSVNVIGTSVNASTGVTVVDRLGLTASTFIFETAQALQFTFNRAVDANLLRAALVLQNLTTGATIPASAMTVTTAGTSARVSFATPLSDGNYRATLPAGSALTTLGDGLPAARTLDYFVLAGDANRDRSVNFDDLLILASNYNTAGRTFSQGDFDYTGTVNFDDLLILASRYNGSLAGAPAAIGAPPPPAALGSTEPPARDDEYVLA